MGFMFPVLPAYLCCDSGSCFAVFLVYSGVVSGRLMAVSSHVKCVKWKLFRTKFQLPSSKVCEWFLLREGSHRAAAILQRVQHSGRSPVQGQQQWLVHGNSLGEHRVILEPSLWPSGVNFFLLTLLQLCTSWVVMPFFDYCTQELSLNDTASCRSWSWTQQLTGLVQLLQILSPMTFVFPVHRNTSIRVMGKGVDVHWMDVQTKERFVWVRVEVVCKEDCSTLLLNISHAWN